MSEKTYTGDEVKAMLAKSMLTFQTSMIGLVRECARHREYRDLTGQEALNKIANKLGGLK